MKTELYGFQYDFIQNNGHSIVFTERQGKPLKVEDINSLQRKMIESNTIPHLLPLEVEEIDFRVRVYYNLTAKRMLTPYLKEKSLSMNEYYTLFLTIISTLEDSRLYMLSDQQYVLKEDFIFIGKNVQDLYLTYLPFNDIEGKNESLEDVKALLLNIAGEVQGLMGGAFKHVLHYIKDPNFNLSGLKALIMKLQAAQTQPHAMYAGSEMASALYTHGHSESAPAFNGEHQRSSSASQQAEASSSQSNKQEKATLKGALPPLTSRERTSSILMVVLSLAILWKLYDAFTVPTMLYICSGLSGVVIILWLMYWKVWRPGVKRQEGREDVPRPKGISAGNVPGREPLFAEGVAYSPYSQPPITDFQMSPAFAEHNSTSSPLSKDDTVMLGDASEVLTESREQKTPSTIRPFLEVIREGNQKEKVKLDTDHFVIGRNAEAVQYVENSIGVSRAHIEFVHLDGTYGVKDLGSKNGTQLNEEQLVPYKLYALKDQDKVFIGKVEYIFRMGT
ncbi:hypothetical protein JOD43_001494 [Pullulanibacillus pueri]|uniref:FHA domain-containing protein n=1 Tax=Pullulanibacillus pueri TaxID=1437324 RepID=A0A8J2ZU45_9BACL|nr:DUF6382 domain-containing protein [Pullulanibacillus pueri]MBM7681327.1 hypothetical protein [Pullulanibacillus pueri]GGH77575.1 hypothetical protein GCM10007096_09670 [Pullulanibacillus pueri]